MAVVRELIAKDFDTAVASGTVLVDFWAPWCSYCRVLGTVIDRNLAALPENLIIAKVNVDDNPDIAARYNITTLPTLILFKDGQQISRHGPLSQAELLKLFS